MRKVIGWGLVVAVAVALVLLLAFRIMAAKAARAVEGPATAAPLPVAVEKAVRRDLVERVTLTGVIRPLNEVDVMAKVPGRIESVAVKVGDTVKAGTLLAVIEHRMLELQEAQARAAADAAAAALDSAKVGLATAKLSYDRMKALYESKALALAEFEKVDAALKGAESGVRAAEAQVAMSRAAAGLAAEALHNARVVSPIAGTVTKRLVDVGTEAGPGRPLFQVQDVSALKLEGAVTAEDYARLKTGAPVRVTVDDLPGMTFAGKVATMSPTLDPMTRRAAVEIAVDNPEGKLLPNMFAHAAVDVGTRSGALCIRAVAVVMQPTGAVVFVVKGGKAVALTPRLGAGDGDWVAVESGIDEGESVVVSGQAGLVAGSAVTVRAGAAKDKGKGEDDDTDKDAAKDKDTDEDKDKSKDAAKDKGTDEAKDKGKVDAKSKGAKDKGKVDAKGKGTDEAKDRGADGDKGDGAARAEPSESVEASAK
ncbi:MAG TPA: efflux RND transporter periplasmic adaptor subunit [Myxococcota bacterium]|jgi:RND family efflux transporter MFP subunit|nr:efflux RND transporter periplasmic adaptor subunit [Myxococcota bacterium]